MAAERQMIVSAVPLLSLYTEVDPGDMLEPVLDPVDTLEVIGLADLVKVELLNQTRTPLYGTVRKLINGGQEVVVASPNGVRWRGCVDAVQVILKASARETKTLASSVEVSVS